MASKANLVFVPCVLALGATNIPNGGAGASKVPNLKYVLCKVGAAQVATSIALSGTRYRTAQKTPFNVSLGGGSALPSGVQWWPITG